MPPILTWLAPPLVGAFIGYMTNYVAIRMLFRPLRPWHLFGLKLPMTPGVIPSKRHDLAINIGRMVGDHLLTSSDVREALKKENFQNDLRSMISGRAREFLGRDLGPAATLVPGRFQSYFKAGIKILRWRTLKHLHSHLDSDRFADTLGRVMEERLNEVFDQEVSKTIPPEMFERFFAFLDETAGDFLSGPEVEKWLTDYLDAKLAAVIDRGDSPADLLPAVLIEQLPILLENELPGLLDKLAGLLEEPEMQDKVAIALSRAVEGFAASLGPMAALLSNFLNPETVRIKIKTYLAQRGDELAGWLIDSDVQEKIGGLLKEKADSFLRKPLKELFRDIDPEKVVRSRGWLARQILAVLRDPATGRAVGSLIRDSLNAQQDRTLGEVVITILGPDGARQSREMLIGETLATVRSRRFKRILDRLLTELIEDRLLTRPIGRLESLLPKEVQQSINEFLLEQTSDILIKEVPALVDSLNISSIVARKVDSLDLLRLEGLLMSIMQEQFRYINLFGGLLGFIIGLANLIFLLNA